MSGIDEGARQAGLDAGMREMFDEMFEGVQLLDADLRYVYVNEAAARHGRNTPEGLVGQRMRDIYPGIEETEMYGLLEDCLGEREPKRLLNQFTYPDGLTGWFELRIAPVPMGVLVLSIDVTDQVRSEERLRAAVAALEEADRRKDDFVAMLAHELRNPLAPIRNGLHLLRLHAREDDDEVAGTRDMMERQLGHLTRMLDDLLDVTRIARGHVRVERTRLDLATVVREAAADHSGVIEVAGLELRVETPDTPVWVMGDETRLAQVLANLLDNARKFTPSGGEVVVRVELDDDPDTATVTVRDSGVGISPELLPRVFDTLSQGDSSLERSGGGLGIGLAVVRGLVELHEGTVEATSEGADRGTTVRVSLPRLPEPAAVGPTGEVGREEPRRARVLIIEDNEDAGDTLATILDLWGYRVGLARSGTEGVEAARRSPPDIVLCDIGLPGMDGYEVARTLRGEAATRASRMIAITGYDGEKDRARSKEAGFDLHLTKPVNPESLRRELEKSA